MPMTHVGRTPHNIAGMDGLDRTAFDLGPPAPFENHETLPQRVLVPRGAGARLEAHQGCANLRLPFRVEQRGDGHGAREPCAWPAGGRSCRAPTEFHRSTIGGSA